MWLTPTGMLLTMADTSCGGLLAGHAGMSVYGPPGLSTLVNAFRTFVNVRDIGLKVIEFGAGAAADAAPEPVVKSELVTITPVTLTAAGGSKEEAQEPEAKRQRVEGGAAADQQGQQQGGGMDIASVAVESPAACYVCELPDVPGKFLPQKVRPEGPLLPAQLMGAGVSAGACGQHLHCLAHHRQLPPSAYRQAASLGVPRGPMYSKLVRGEEVTAANGQTVRPADVMEPATPGVLAAGAAYAAGHVQWAGC